MDHIEIKASLTVDDSGAITGTAWPFGSPDMVGDVIEKGAFSAPAKLPMLFAHDQAQAVGVWDGVTEDGAGLQVRGRLLIDDVARAREVRALVREGAVTGLSIGFVTRKSAPRRGGGRTITDLDLHEISIVPVPSHPGARVITIKEARMSTKTLEKKEEGEAPTVEDRVSSLESDVSTLKSDVAAIKGSSEEAEKTLNRIEVKMNRPITGDITGDDAKQVERKALSGFLRTGSDIEMKAATTTNDPEGGYFVLPTVDMSIRNLLKDVSPLRQLAEVVSISGGTYERFYSTGNRGAQWVEHEAQTRPQDTARPDLIKHSYSVAELYASPAGTRQLFEDASFDVASWFNTWAVNDFAITEGEAFLSGNGTGNKPRGLMTYPIVATADASRAWASMQYLPAGHASAPTDDNWAKALVKTVLTLHSKYRPGAAWLMNNATLIRMREIQDSNKRFMWSDHGNLSESPESGTLLGYPVHIDNNMDDIGGGAHPIAFGNFTQGYVIVDRHGIRIVRDETTVKGTILLDTYKRVGGGLGDSNAIKWLKVATS